MTFILKLWLTIMVVLLVGQIVPVIKGVKDDIFETTLNKVTYIAFLALGWVVLAMVVIMSWVSGVN